MRSLFLSGFVQALLIVRGHEQYSVCRDRRFVPSITGSWIQQNRMWLPSTRHTVPLPYIA